MYRIYSANRQMAQKSFSSKWSKLDYENFETKIFNISNFSPANFRVVEFKSIGLVVKFFKS